MRKAESRNLSFRMLERSLCTAKINQLFRNDNFALYFWYTAAWRTACCRQSFSLFVHVVWFVYLCRLNEQQEAFRA